MWLLPLEKLQAKCLKVLTRVSLLSDVTPEACVGTEAVCEDIYIAIIFSMQKGVPVLRENVMKLLNIKANHLPPSSN